MENRSKKTVSISNNHFIVFSILLVSILVISFAFSFIDKRYHLIPWPCDYASTVGVSSQVITAVISFVTSIIGIAISLQNEEYFGVKITKLYGLRVKKHCSILSIIVYSISLSASNLTFYMLGLNIAAIGTLIVATLFLLQVVRAEVPIMSKDEKALLSILKDNLIFCYLNKVEASKDLKDAIKYLLYTKNLKEMYELFKDKHDQIYNQYVFMKLLEFQHDLAFEIKDKHSDEQKIVGSSLLQNTFDVLLRHIDFPDEIYSEVVKNKHLLTRVLFQLHELPETKEELFNKISSLFQCLLFISDDSKQEGDLISDIIITMTAITVREGDLDIIRAVRHQLSNCLYCLDRPSHALDVFAVLSMYLYYMACSEPDVPVEVKEKIKVFVNDGNIIEDRTQIASWQQLFSDAARYFKVNYNRFIALSTRNENVLEYYLFGAGAKVLILDKAYLSQWYLTHLLNTQQIYGIDFPSLITKYPDIKPHLKNLGNSCIDKNNVFVPTAEMEKIAAFFGDKTKNFSYFTTNEEQTHDFFRLVNEIKREDLKASSEKAAKVDNGVFAKEIHDEIDMALKSEWGYDSNLPTDSTDRYLSVQFEKVPEAINFKKSIINHCINSIWADLRRATQKTILYDDGHFEDGIRQILSRKPQYVTARAKNMIPHVLAKDESLRQMFIDICAPLAEFQSRLIGTTAILLDDNFRFNCEIQKVELRELSEEELSKEVVAHQRADGQFVFNGVFLPQEEIAKIIKDKYAVLTIIIRHRVISSKDTIFKLEPYLKKSEENPN